MTRAFRSVASFRDAQKDTRKIFVCVVFAASTTLGDAERVRPRVAEAEATGRARERHAHIATVVRTDFTIAFRTAFQSRRGPETRVRVWRRGGNRRRRAVRIRRSFGFSNGISHEAFGAFVARRGVGAAAERLAPNSLRGAELRGRAKGVHPAKLRAGQAPVGAARGVAGHPSTRVGAATGVARGCRRRRLDAREARTSSDALGRSQTRGALQQRGPRHALGGVAATRANARAELARERRARGVQPLDGVVEDLGVIVPGREVRAEPGGKLHADRPPRHRSHRGRQRRRSAGLAPSRARRSGVLLAGVPSRVCQLLDR